MGERVPERLGRYGLMRVLGRGGMGVVYEAHDPRFGRDVALKMLPGHLLAEPEFQRRFEQEARVAASLEHSAVVPVYDFGQQDGRPYMVMRLMPGGSLRDRLSVGRLGLAEAHKVLRRLAPALDFVHRRGVLHRDIKPENILFDEEGDAWLSDFGVARVMARSGAVTSVGTPAYMSPELIEGAAEVDGRSDLYALAAVTFEMISGQPPYLAGMRALAARLTDPPPSLRAVAPEAPPASDAVIARALSVEPGLRHATACEFLEAMGAALGVVTPAGLMDTAPASDPVVGGGRLGEVFALAWSPDNKALACGNSAGVLRVWSGPQWSERQIKAHRGPVLDLAWSLTGRQLVTGGEDAVVHLWDGVGLRLVDTFGPTHAPVYGVALSPDGGTLAAGTFRGELAVWRTGGGEAVARRQVGFAVLGVDFSPDGRTLAVAVGPDAVMLLDAGDLSPRGVLEVPRRDVRRTYLRRLCFNPSGTWLATAGFDGVARVWEVEDGAEVATLDAGLDLFSDVSFDPSGTMLAVGSRQGTAVIWDVASGRELARLEGHASPCKSVAFDRTGRRLATGSHDATVRIWGADPTAPDFGRCLHIIR